MSFVTPALLAGSLAVAVPIVLHLVMRRKPRHMEFPALRLLKMRKEANQRKMRLRHLLLLALRVAAIGLIALALARPTLRGTAGAGEEGPIAVALVFDTGPRMDYRHENQTRLEQAGEVARGLLSRLPAGSEVAVLDGHGGETAFAVDLGAAGQRIARLRTAPLARPVSESLAAAWDLVAESLLPRKEVYVFSDMSRAAWEGPDWETTSARLAEALATDAGTALYAIDVGVAEPQNVGLGDLRIARAWLASGGRLELAADVERIGRGAGGRAELYVIDAAGTPQKRGEQTLGAAQGAAQGADLAEDVSADGASGDSSGDNSSDGNTNDGAAQRDEVRFQVAGLEPGSHQGYVRIAGGDALSWDDTRFFSCEVAPAWPVLLVAARPADTLLLSEALAPSAFRARGEARFDCTVVDQQELTRARLDDYRIVALVDPRPLEAGDWERLAEYVEGGGGLAIFLGRNAVPIGAFSGANAQRLLPGPLKRQWRQETWLAPNDLSHPLLRAFRPLASNVPWRTFPVLKYWQVAPLDEDARVVISYASGHAALVERSVGRGRAITMTTPVSDPTGRRDRPPWNLLPAGPEPWPYVMLVNETMLYLAGSRYERLNYRCGETAVLPAGAEGPPPLVALTTPRGDVVRQSVDRQQSAIIVTSTGEVGNYRVRGSGQLDRAFSVNLPASATRLERIDVEELNERLGADRLQVAHSREEIARQVSAGRTGRELFPLLILIVAGVLGMEQVVSNTFYGRGE